MYNSNPFPEDLGGCRLAGDVTYAIPPGTTLAGNGYCVLAKDAASVQAWYSLTNTTVLGYGILQFKTNVVGGVTNVTSSFGNALSRNGSLQLINSCGGVVLNFTYSNDNPWPVGADGTGHSMVLEIARSE